MRRLIPLPVRVVLAALLAASLACATLRPMGAGEQFIQGAWSHGEDFGDGHGSYLEWTFDRGRFSVEGYPPLTQTGQYRVISEKAGTLTLALTEQAGDWPTDDRELTIVIDGSTNALTIDNAGPFNPTSP